MVNCKNIKELISLIAADEASADEIAIVEKHIQSCEECREEYDAVSILCSEYIESVSEADSIADNIDFAEIMRSEIRKDRFTENKIKQGLFSRLNVSVRTVSSFAAVFIVGILTGYIAFMNMQTDDDKFKESFVPREISAERVEAVHAKQQVMSFLKESQMILTDMMREGEYSDAGVRKAGLLLRKSRYFKSNLKQVDLMSSKQLLEKISWFLYEISSMDRENYLKEMNRLQLLIEKERLLMKIRLVEKELESHSEKRNNARELRI